jgi:hypothetical protein
MATDLQNLAEGLAERLGRSVAIDDNRLHLLAHSAHRGEVDAARAESILRRAVPQAVVDHVFSCRDDATGMFLVTPRADLGLTDTRVGVPIVQDGSLLGIVWLLLSDGPVEEHLAQTRRAAADAAVVIHREYLRAGSVQERETALTDALLGLDAARRDAAAAEILSDGLFRGGPFAVIAAEVGDPVAAVDDEDQLALASALAVVRSRRLPHDVLSLERRGHVILLVAEPAGDGGRDEMRTLAASLRHAVLAKSRAAQCWVGVSRSRDAMTDAGSSLDEALRAARISRRLGDADPVAAIDELGVYELLDRIPDDALRATIHPGLRALIDQGGRGDALVQTLEVFLDNAGDVKAASEQMFAHRTSLYYRLRRIHEITGLDMSKGDDRLTAQLGLKIVRLLDGDPTDG